MFIIKCERDNSFCKVADTEVIFVKDSPPKKNEIVKFTYGGKEELGEVILISDDTKQINTKFEQIKKSLKKRLPSRLSPGEKNESSVPAKRSRILNSKYNSPSFENLNLSKLSKVHQTEKREIKVDNKKKSDKIGQSQIEKEIIHKQGKPIKPKGKERSPTKDELKKQLAKFKEQVEKSKKSADQLDDAIASLPSRTIAVKKNIDEDDSASTESDSDVSTPKASSSSDSHNSSESNDSVIQDSKIRKGDNYYDKENDSQNTIIDKSSPNNLITEYTDIDDYNDPDLYGKDWGGETMVKLMDKIYCTEREYKLCKCLCSQASHVVRRLITGVFKPSGYLDATLTGQAPRAHLQKGKSAPVKALNAMAKDEIIDFAMALAKAKKWVTPKGVPQTKEQLASVMSQRIGELKRTHLANH